uniref:Uncharacterized protein n=1 Tax=Oryza nivara TaxID=4536 RepID=A0A0E0FXX2_ORYNI
MAMATTGSNSSSRHRGVHVELQHGVQLGLHLGRPPQHVPGRSPEHPAAADHRQLPDLLGGVVAAGDDDGAPVVWPVGEHQRDVDDEHRPRHGRQHVRPLRPPNLPGRQAWALRHHVVDDHRVAEVVPRRHGRVRRPRPLHHHHRRLPRPAHDVVHVHPQPHRLPTRRGRRHGGRDGEDQSHGGD